MVGGGEWGVIKYGVSVWEEKEMAEAESFSYKVVACRDAQW